MMNPMLRVFDSFQVAQQARQALLDAGVTADAISLQSREDDGGPVQGNFIVDLEQKRTPAVDDPRRQSEQSELRTPVPRDCCLLQVDAADAEEAAAIDRILDHYDRADHDERMDSRPS